MGTKRLLQKMKASVYFHNQVNHAVPNGPDEVTSPTEATKSFQNTRKIDHWITEQSAMIIIIAP